MQAALEHALIGVCVLDAATLHATWCNATFRRFVVTALRDAEIVGRPAGEFVPRFEEHTYEQIFRHVTESGRPFVNLEDEHRDAAGVRTYWRWSVSATSPGELLIQAVDVTEQVSMRRQAASARAGAIAARQQSARIEAILDSTDEGIVVGDTSGNVLYMNPAARRIHGFGPSDKPERHLNDYARRFELRNPGDGKVVPVEQWPLNRALRGEQFSGVELTVRRLDVEHEVVVAYSGAKVVPHGARSSVVIIGVRDVTARKQSQRELEHARHQAESASRAKDEFLAVLSHELRTPLTPVLTAAQAMESDPEVPESLRVTAGMIRRNVELEARLIDDLLDLTRISRGKLRLDFTRTDIHEKIQNVVEILADDARAKGVRLIVSLDARRRYVRADPARWDPLESTCRHASLSIL